MHGIVRVALIFMRKKKEWLAPAWKPGQSGNPAGSKPGRPDWRSRLRRMFEDAGPEVCAVIIGKARDGDNVAAKLVLERIVPLLKPRDNWPGLSIKPGATLLEQVQCATAAVMAGDISPLDAAPIVRLVALESALATAAEGGKGLSAEDVIRLLNSEVSSPIEPTDETISQ